MKESIATGDSCTHCCTFYVGKDEPLSMRIVLPENTCQPGLMPFMAFNHQYNSTLTIHSIGLQFLQPCDRQLHGVWHEKP